MSDPAFVARENGRNTVRQTLGAMRSFASKAAHACPELDEEEFFALVSEHWLKGLRQEVSKIFGPTKARRLLDPFAQCRTSSKQIAKD